MQDFYYVFTMCSFYIGSQSILLNQYFFSEKSHNSLWSKLVMVLVLVHFIKKMRKLPVIFLALFKIFIKMSCNLFNILQKRFLRRHKWVFYSFSRWFLFIAAFTLKVTFNGLEYAESFYDWNTLNFGITTTE